MPESAISCGEIGTSSRRKKNYLESDREILELEEAIASESPFYLLEEDILDIKDKAGDLVRLRLNEAQRRIHEKIKECRRMKKPARLILLKSRQLGASTYSEALLYALTSQQENRNSLIMADQVDKSNYLFEMCKLFQERMEMSHPHLVHPLKKSNEKKLEWVGTHSQIIIETGQNVNATRAYTYQYVHLSEAAFFPDLGGVLKGLQGVPKHEDTAVIVESTANGYGTEFHKLWDEAVKGHSDWIPVFLPWFIMAEYTKPLVGGKMYPLEGMEFDTEGGERDFLAEEENLRMRFSLSREQLNWRRWVIINDLNRKVRDFREEYPADADEAFLVSGGCVFDTQKLKKQRDKRVKPIAIGNLVEVDGRVEFRDDILGGFSVYEWPHLAMRCVIGADTAEGIGEDFHAAVAIDRATNNTVMVFHSNAIDVDQYEIELKKMGKYLNDALVGPESFPSATGYSVTHGLHKLYGNVYRRIVEDERTQKRTEKLGWYNDHRSRRQAIDQFIEEIREDATELRDAALISECLTFVRDPETGKIEAQKSSHDDLVMARVIAGKLRQLYPLSVKRSANPPHDYGEGRRMRKKREPLSSWK